jgi:hypothetical protein
MATRAVFTPTRASTRQAPQVFAKMRLAGEYSHTCEYSVRESDKSLQNCLANVGESTQNCLANVGKSGESTNKRNRDVGECHKYVSARVPMIRYVVL